MLTLENPVCLVNAVFVLALLPFMNEHGIPMMAYCPLLKTNDLGGQQPLADMAMMGQMGWMSESVTEKLSKRTLSSRL